MRGFPLGSATPLAREYGDFIAKATLFEYLVQVFFFVPDYLFGAVGVFDSCGPSMMLQLES